MAPALLKKLFERSPQSRDNEKRRLLTQQQRNEQTDLKDDSNIGNQKSFSSAKTEKRKKDDSEPSYVQICPHETLSFERVKRIMNLPNFQREWPRAKVGAFTSVPGHHHVLSEEGDLVCKPYRDTFKSLEARGYYRYVESHCGTTDGFMLCVDWTMEVDHLMDTITDSLTDLQSFLDTLDINLCQHVKLGDCRITTKLYNFCNEYRPIQDPVEAYIGRRIGDQMECRKCYTTFDIREEGDVFRITVKRYMGLGFSAYDHRWLIQCGEERHTLKSIGVAAKQSWNYGMAW